MSNKKQNLSWSDAVRKSVREAEEPLDAALWSRIERSLDGEMVVAQNRLRVRRKVLWGAVSGVAAAVLIALFVLDKPADIVGEIADSQLLITEQVTSVEGVEVVEIVEVEEDVEMADIVEVVASENVRSENLSGMRGDAVALVESGEAQSVDLILAQEDVVPFSESVEDEVIEFETKDSEVAVENSDDSIDVQEQSFEYLYFEESNYQMEQFIEKANKKSRLSVLYAGGVGFGSSSSADNKIPIASDASYEPTEIRMGVAEIGFDDYYKTSVVAHYQPITAGLKFHHEVLPQLWISGGLSYTQLISDVYMAGNEESMLKQRIHLLGVPVAVNYNFFEKSGFTLYAGAGATVEYCLGASVGSRSIDEVDWHYSANLSVGAQYSFTDWMGIYLEPSLSRYFTKTNLYSMITDMPVMFNLTLGFSFTF